MSHLYTFSAVSTELCSSPDIDPTVDRVFHEQLHPQIETRVCTTSVTIHNTSSYGRGWLKNIRSASDDITKDKPSLTHKLDRGTQERSG